jgi:glyoxylase-like metal-dependent hydrolase (beta-lactamase superfamily II)
MVKAIIDPLREVQPYLDRLERDNVKLKYIFETHFHDFVSGHLDLSKKLGIIVYGKMQTKFEAIIATEDQEFSLGDIKIKALHTWTYHGKYHLFID